MTASPFGQFALRSVRAGNLRDRINLLRELVYLGVQDPEMRQLALQITAGCEGRDDLCELRAIFDYHKARLRYTGDIAGIDTFSSWKQSLAAGGGDCLPTGTLLLDDQHRFVPIEELREGARIWGRDAWTRVEHVWYKGVLPIDVVHLNNGSRVKATADHKVYMARCATHRTRWEDGTSCSCPMEAREVERVFVKDLEPGMVVVQPERVAFGTETMDADRAWVEGVFLADGWCDRNSEFRISGQDGCPKEEQKRKVQAACARLGVETRWARKCIAVKSPEWALRVQQMGRYAREKHALSIALDEGAAAPLLRGIMADSDVRFGVFTSTSRALALQVRLLHRMFGVTCGESYIPDHGGLGRHPIWRITPRRGGSASNKKLCRVRSIDRDVVRAPVYDLTTEDHYVYLPEADVVVSNCDDHTVANATALVHNGFSVIARVTTANSQPEHIYSVAIFPKLPPHQGGVALDTTLPGGNLGDEPVGVRKVWDEPLWVA